MKTILHTIQFLSIRKLLLIGGVVIMFVLVAMGPAMLRASQKSIIPIVAKETAQSVPLSSTTTNATNGTTAGFDPSTFNVTPITNPDGSISFPTYTIPTTSTTPTTPTGSVPVTRGDPDKCSAAQTAMSTVDASYADIDAQLHQEVTNYQNFLINNSKNYAARGYGPTTDEQMADQRANIAMQNDNNTLMNNVRDINNRKAPYQLIVTQNC